MSRTRASGHVWAMLWSLGVLTACGGGGGSGNGGGGGGGGPDWYVDAALGSDAGAGTAASPFETVTHALSVAVAGDTVHVAPGTYDVDIGETFPLIVPEGVALIGDEPNKGAGVIPTLLLGGGVVPPPDLGGMGRATLVPRTGSVVAGFRIQNPETTGFRFGILLPDPGVALRNNLVEQAQSAGIYFYNGAGTHVITGNVLRLNNTGLAFINGGVGSLVEGNLIWQNQIGVEYDSAGGDMGGGSAGSNGENTISCNERADLWTNAVVIIHAQNNLWDHMGPTMSTTTDGGGIDIYNAGGAADIQTQGDQLASTSCL